MVLEAVSTAELRLVEHAQCGALTSFARELSHRLPHARVRSVAKGAFVYRTGDATDHFYLVLEGRVRTSILGDAGQEFILQDYGPGQAFGELCFCEVRARQEQAVALEPTQLARIGLEELEAFSTADGLWQLLEMFTHRLADLERQLHELSTSPVRDRLVRFLLRHAQAAGTEDGLSPLDGSFTHQEIAARVFTTREQVSAHLAALRRQGMVLYGRGEAMRIRAPQLRSLLS